MKPKLLLIALVFSICSAVHADDTAFFKLGPLSLNVPFKTASVTYLYDFNAKKNLVGGETPVVTLWERLEGTVGAVTSLEGQGAPFVGGNLLIGNVLARYIVLPSDLKVGGFGGWDFNADAPIYGLKASYKLW